MTTRPNVTVEGLGKKFGLSLKSAMKYGLLDSLRRLAGRGKSEALRPGEFWALREVSFALEPGDALGIMGVNGSGKTTMLRIFNGTYTPDAGRVTLRGRIGALIAAGAGFAPLLTGRENVFISGALLGMTPREIRRRFDAIVDFAELGEFIDMPVRNYSSGMAVRLGFSVAIMGRPDVLLVDEVLAVGDLSFQKKCYERIMALREAGTTILLVSHSPGAIWAVCNKGLVLNHGQSNGIIKVEEACKQYELYNLLERSKTAQEDTNDTITSNYGGNRGGTKDAIMDKLEILSEKYNLINQLEYAFPFILRYHITVESDIDNAIIRTTIDSEINKSVVVIDSYEIHNELYCFSKGKYIIDIHINNPKLRPGVYQFNSAVLKKDVGVHLFFQFNQAQLTITHPKDIFFYADFRASYQIDAEYSIKKCLREK